MKKKSAARWKFKYASLALAASLAACGGGGSGGGGGLAGFGGLAGAGGTSGNDGSGDNTGGVAASGARISGVAATGAPLVGTVTVKDALGATRTASIGSNGSYTVDVGGMTAPFVFRAEGSVNGMTATVHSIATQADIDGRINITQLTNLVVSNIAGRIAANYFDKFEQDGNAGLASKALVDAEVDKLKEKLLPVLTALGVEAAIDLLHGTFTPLADPIDKALDVIRVQYDAAANTAIISNILNATTVVDDLSKQAAAEPSPATLSSENVATGVSDQVLVRKVLEDFSARFASGLPSPSDLSPLMTATFMWNDQNRATWLNEFSQASDFIGIAFTDVEIHRIDYSDPTRITANLSLTPKTAQGVELGRIDDWKVRKGVDGIWRLHGDQRALDLEGFATTAIRYGAAGSAAGGCMDSGIEFNITDHDNANNGGSIRYILVTGAGLPAGGLRYEEPAPGERWKIAGLNVETHVMASNCAGASPGSADATIAAIPDDSVYTLTAYDSNGAKVVIPTGTSDGAYRLKIQRRPLTLAEAAAPGVFPVIAPATVSAFEGFASGTLAFSASNVYPLSQAYVQMRRRDAALELVDAVEVAALPAADGTVDASLSFAVDPRVASSTMWVESPDRYRRNIQTYYTR